MNVNGAAARELELTGERFHPSMRGAIRYEHLHRYALCLSLVDGLDVLDIASGEGYGSALLASRARRVIGVDVDQRAVEHARRTYYHPNVRFLAGDCNAIPLGDATVDVVVSFETLEHIGAHDEMLAEIRRVLRPRGRLVISSPNKLVYSDEPGYENPYHVRELYYDEFLQLLERNFASVRVHGQRLAAASFVYPLVDRLAGGVPSYGVNGSDPRDGLPALDRPMYFIAVCGDTPHDGPGIDSVFVDAHDDLFQLLQDEHERAHRLLRVQQDALEAMRSAEGRTLAIEGAVAGEPLRLATAAPSGAADLRRSVELLTAERDAIASHRDALLADAEAAMAARRDRDEIHADRLRLQRRLDAALRELNDVRERADAYSAERYRLVGEADRAREETAAAASVAHRLGERLDAIAAERDALVARAEEERRDREAERRDREAERHDWEAERREWETERRDREAERASAQDRVDTVQCEAQRLEQRAEASAAERADLATEAERERGAFAVERAQLHREREALVADLERAAEHAEAAGAERDAVIARAERDRVDDAADRARLQGRLDALTAETGRMRAQLGVLAAEREKLVARAEHDERMLRQLLASRSWRLTAPLRELVKTFK
ncbi:MAG TPA: methyltransferase domain-containing protein [Candidatus Elarobacter sp.]|jgi:ubiquinone/menaquinone biosynthesis C-methylase UbiE